MKRIFIFVFLVLIPPISFSQKSISGLQWFSYAGKKILSSYEANELDLTGKQLLISEKSFQDYEFSFSFTPQNIHNDQPFSIYFNIEEKSSDPLYSYYRLTYTNYNNPAVPRNHGPRWRISKKKTDFNNWDELDFFPSSSITAPVEQKNYRVKIVSREIPTADSSVPLVYISVQINDYIVCSIVDKTAPIKGGKLGFSVNNSNLGVKEIAVEQPIQLPQEAILDKVVVFGDSIVFGDELTRDKAASSVILQNLLGSEYQVLNFGFPGEKTSNSLTTKWHEGLFRFQQIIDVERPEFIIIEEGTNNLHENDVVSDLTSMVTYARAHGVQPILATLTPLYNGDNPEAVNNGIIQLAKQQDIPFINLWEEFTAPDKFKADLPETNNINSPRDLITADGIHVVDAGHYKTGQLFYRAIKHIMDSRYEAMWIGQSYVNSGGMKTIVLEPDQEVNLTAVFKNIGETTWLNAGSRRVAFYVYRDPPWSRPPEYNLPNNSSFGTDYFATDSWGASFDGKTKLCRAAILQEEKVKPGETGTFSFSLKAPLDAIPNPVFDDPKTPWDETMYRSDFSLAAGSYWIHNYTNGDPNHIAHTWFGVRVVEKQPTSRVDWPRLLFAINI